MTGPLPRHAAPGTEPLVRPSEAVVLALLCKGRSDKEIARAIGLSVATATHRVRCLMSRFGVKNRTALAHAAGLQGLGR